jgi:hypothetical protein
MKKSRKNIEMESIMCGFGRLLLPGLLGLMFIVSCSTTSNSTARDNIQPQVVKQNMAQLIIKFRQTDFDPSQGDYLQKISLDIKATLIYLRPMSGGEHIFRVVDISDDVQLLKLIRRLSTRPEILYVEQDRIMQHQKVQ